MNTGYSIKRWFKSLLLLAPLWATLTVAAAPATPATPVPAGIVLDVLGKVEVAGKPLNLFDYLYPGNEALLAAGAKLVVTEHQTNRELAFTGPGKVKVSPEGISATAGAKLASRELQALQVNAASQGVARRHQQAAITLRSLDPLLAPRHHSAVRDVRPEFSWMVSGGQLSLAVYDAAGGQVASLPLAPEGRMRLPEYVNLEPGQTYGWTILSADGTPLSSSRKAFRVLSVAEQQLIDSSRPADSAGVADWALYAALLENYWLGDEARSIWQRLANERPNDANLKRFAK